MAIKERKQITGTTAQIDAYKGHEGQIVWDKDKKTFVGMSGTAGKNYPLAQKAYVDTKFLPLTGGTLTGDLIVNPKNGEFAIELPEWGKEGLGARIGFNSADREGYEGQLILQASSRTRSLGVVLNPERNELLFNGSPVASFDRLDNDIVRFRNGLQILKGSVLFTPGAGSRYNFSLPFSGTVHVAACIIGGQSGDQYPPFSIDEVSVTGFRARSPSSWSGSFIAIGRWK